MRNIILILSGIFFVGSIAFSQTSYMNESENTKILKEILKEIGELKKGQDKLKKEIANLKSAAPANSNKGCCSKRWKEKCTYWKLYGTWKSRCTCYNN